MSQNPHNREPWLKRFADYTGLVQILDQEKLEDVIRWTTPTRSAPHVGDRYRLKASGREVHIKAVATWVSEPDKPRVVVVFDDGEEAGLGWQEFLKDAEPI